MKLNTICSLIVLLLCLGVLLSACGGQNDSEETTASTDLETEAAYRVTVADALGKPYTTGVVVAFFRNGEQVAMQTVDANGVAEKKLEKGDYTVELVFADDESAYHYDKTDLTLSAEKTELTVLLSNAIAGESSTLTVQGEEYAAYTVKEGCTYIEPTAGERSYFLFTPIEAGTYKFSVTDPTAKIGYYGAPHFVQSESAAEVTDNAFTVSISASMIGTEGGTSEIVIGVDGGEAASCTLAVERIGDAAWSLEDEPWMVYAPTVELTPYTLPAGANLVNFDLTASTDTYKLVLNETDGFYHLDAADGPLVLMRLGSECQYIDCYQKILENAGVCKYFFDENGEFIKKENYTECLMKYIENMDENAGVYPLTEDLAYIVQQHGDHSQWWNTEGNAYLFVDNDGNMVPNINSEIAWLLMCCYIA